MTRPLAISVLLGLSLGLHAQKKIYTIQADSVKITYCDSAELILENHTQNVPGFLFNTGNGRTIFKRGAQQLGNGAYLVGADTVKAWVQGGNAFGTTGVLGTTDNNPLDLYTNNAAQARLTTNGHLIVGATADSGYNLDVKGVARFGAYNSVTTVRGNLNFDNSFPGNNSYIMQGGSTIRSLLIPGSGGNAPWTFNNAGDWGVWVVDQSGSVYLQGGTINLRSPNFADVGYILSTAPSTAMNRTIYFGSGRVQYANENGTNISIRGGTGGYAPVTYVFNGGNVSINGGEQGVNGAKGNILLNNQVYGNVGIQTGTPVSNLEVDQGTMGSGTVSNDAGGTTVRGTSTLFTNTFRVGDSITINVQTVAIQAIASDTRMTTDPITTADSMVTYTLRGGSRFHVKGNGTVGIGTSTPASQLDILGSKGYSQLRLRTPYTPTSSSDPNGNVGDISWDENYIYIRTSSGWKRSSLGTF